MGLKFKIIEGLDRVWALIGIENEPISLNVTHLSLCFHQEGTFLKFERKTCFNIQRKQRVSLETFLIFYRHCIIAILNDLMKVHMEL